MVMTVLRVNNVHSPGAMVNNPTYSKALTSTKVKHGDSGAVT